MRVNLLSVVLLGVFGSILICILRSAKPEFETAAVLGIVAVIMLYCLEKLETIIGVFQILEQYIDLNRDYVGTLIRIVGITYLSEFAAGICKDAGNHSVAASIELFAKLSIAAVSMPIVLALLQLIEYFF